MKHHSNHDSSDVDAASKNELELEKMKKYSMNVHKVISDRMLEPEIDTEDSATEAYKDKSFYAFDINDLDALRIYFDYDTKIIDVIPSFSGLKNLSTENLDWILLPLRYLPYSRMGYNPMYNLGKTAKEIVPDYQHHQRVTTLGEVFYMAAYTSNILSTIFENPVVPCFSVDSNDPSRIYLKFVCNDRKINATAATSINQKGHVILSNDLCYYFPYDKICNIKANLQVKFGGTIDGSIDLVFPKVYPINRETFKLLKYIYYKQPLYKETDVLPLDKEVLFKSDANARINLFIQNEDTVESSCIIQRAGLKVHYHNVVDKFYFTYNFYMRNIIPLLSHHSIAAVNTFKQNNASLKNSVQFSYMDIGNTIEYDDSRNGHCKLNKYVETEITLPGSENYFTQVQCGLFKSFTLYSLMKKLNKSIKYSSLMNATQVTVGGGCGCTFSYGKSIGQNANNTLPFIDLFHSTAPTNLFTTLRGFTNRGIGDCDFGYCLQKNFVRTNDYIGFSSYVAGRGEISMPFNFIRKGPFFDVRTNMDGAKLFAYLDFLNPSIAFSQITRISTGIGLSFSANKNLLFEINGALPLRCADTDSTSMFNFGINFKTHFQN